MENQKECDVIKGISVCNPVDVEKDYLLFTVEYAKKNESNHLQIIGPIHDAVKGNIDGMTFYRKYKEFNDEKCQEYVEQAMDAVHAACKKTTEYGIKTYVWHHELELPARFKEVYPEVKNGCGDIEVTHPRIKDFLQHKIQDFFYVYPDIDGIILTLHETRTPLLKLKNQKLGKIERVKYVTKILYDTCQKLGKELIVRTFASIEEDYVMMAQAYEEISSELLIMDKWTQFDWSLSLPHNGFYKKIKKNPLLVEADIFGEFFGKGRLPLMLREHIGNKFSYCSAFHPKGYVARIDRGGADPFGDVNEVNIVITHAYLNQENVDDKINEFFSGKYGEAAKEVIGLMDQTEDILKKTFYLKGYYFTELSYFPTLNHSKNHYYFEMMRKDSRIVSDEWYIPKNWERGSIASLLKEKEEAVSEAAKLFSDLQMLEGKMDFAEYEKLRVKFLNLKLVTEIWYHLTCVFVMYANYFDTSSVNSERELMQHLDTLLHKNQQGIELLGEKFYCVNAVEAIGPEKDIVSFVENVREGFAIEKETIGQFGAESGLMDYVVCGGATEGHCLQKEVNFSDTLVRDGMFCRIPGSSRGDKWCSINAHGWFSYEICIRSYAENKVEILLGSMDEEICVSIQIGEQKYTVSEKAAGGKEFCFTYMESKGEDTVRICFNKISESTPCVFWIKVR